MLTFVSENVTQNLRISDTERAHDVCSSRVAGHQALRFARCALLNRAYTAEYRFGLSKLVPAADVQRFAELYVATSVLAKRFRLNSVAFARYLREPGTPLLVVPLSDKRKEHALFLHKDVAAQIQIPSRKMLKEHAQRRTEAARKQHWAEYRRARETALGKPMRRVRMKHR